ncbi:MAG: type I phosphomannose isomerase catalytic subunit [Chitinophagaceae bacterium]
MQITGKIFQLKGKIQNYAWGGFNFLPQLLHFTNEAQQPCAEYWMGAHPSASSIISDGKNSISLNEFIQQNPSATLTDKVFETFVIRLVAIS